MSDLPVSHHIESLEEEFFYIESRIQKPYFDSRIGNFRYFFQDDILCATLKLGKIISTLRGMMILWKDNHLQECCALVRICDELESEIYYVCNCETHVLFRFLRAFYSEEFDDPSHPITRSKGRDTVPARKVRATLANSPFLKAEQSRMQEASVAVHRAFSGYVHGAFPQIMDMYGGIPPTFHLHGVPNPELSESVMYNIASYTFRGFASAAFIYLRVNDAESAKRATDKAQAVSEEFALTSE